jgi:hypothetical protein
VGVTAAGVRDAATGRIVESAAARGQVDSGNSQPRRRGAPHELPTARRPTRRVLRGAGHDAAGVEQTMADAELRSIGSQGAGSCSDAHRLAAARRSEQGLLEQLAGRAGTGLSSGFLVDIAAKAKERLPACPRICLGRAIRGKQSARCRSRCAHAQSDGGRTNLVQVMVREQSRTMGETHRSGSKRADAWGQWWAGRAPARDSLSRTGPPATPN